MEQTDKRKQDKLKFDRVINLARRLPQPAIHDLLRALILPIRGSRDFPSKNDKVLWRPRRPWPPEGYYFSLTGKYPSIERISSSRSGNFSLNSKW